MSKPKLKYAQRGQNLTLSIQIGRKKPESYSMRIVEKDERDKTADKIKGHIAAIEKSSSNSVIDKRLKSVSNIFMKHAKAKQKELDAKKAQTKSVAKKAKKDKKSVKMLGAGSVTKAVKKGSKAVKETTSKRSTKTATKGVSRRGEYYGR